MSTATLITAEQLLEMPENRWNELVEGELRPMTPAGWRHGAVVTRLAGMLDRHVRERNLGLVLSGDPGFFLARDPDTVRAPDIAFIRADRLAAAPPREAFWPGAPDLAVEVVSPGDALSEVRDKALAWLDAGAALVWVVNPARRAVTVFRSPSDIETLSAGAELDGGDLLPGFRCPIADLFVNP